MTFITFASGALSLLVGTALLISGVDEPEITYACIFSGLVVLVGPQAFRAATSRGRARLIPIVALPLLLGSCFLFDGKSIPQKWVEQSERGQRADKLRLDYFSGLIPQTAFKDHPETQATLRAWGAENKAWIEQNAEARQELGQ